MVFKSVRHVSAKFTGFQTLRHRSGLIENKNAVRAVSREGGKEELLYGPFYYTIVLILTTLLFWRDSPVGFLVVSIMSVAMGWLDIVGRRLEKTVKNGRNRLTKENPSPGALLWSSRDLYLRYL